MPSPELFSVTLSVPASLPGCIRLSIKKILNYGEIQKETVYELLDIPEWIIVTIGFIGIVALLFQIEMTGL